MQIEHPGHRHIALYLMTPPVRLFDIDLSVDVHGFGWGKRDADADSGC